MAEGKSLLMFYTSGLVEGYAVIRELGNKAIQNEGIKNLWEMQLKLIVGLSLSIWTFYPYRSSNKTYSGRHNAENTITV